MCAAGPGAHAGWRANFLNSAQRKAGQKDHFDWVVQDGSVVHRSSVPELIEADHKRNTIQPNPESPPDMVNNRTVDPNADRSKTSYSERNTPKKERLKAGYQGPPEGYVIGEGWQPGYGPLKEQNLPKVQSPWTRNIFKDTSINTP